MQSTHQDAAAGEIAEGRPQAKKPASTDPGEGRRVRDAAAPREIGGRAGPDPTRFGDWEKNGRCIDF